MDHFVSGSNFGCLIQQSGSVLRKPGLGGRLDSIQGRCNVGCLRSRFNCEVMVGVSAFHANSTSCISVYTQGLSASSGELSIVYFGCW